MSAEQPELAPRNPTILVAYDGSDNARRAVQRAGELFPGCTTLVVTAWMGVADTAPELLLAPGGVLFATVGVLSDTMKERATEVSAEGARLATEAGLVAEARAVHSRHAMWEGLLRCAHESDARVIVVGSRGHAAIVAAVLGSVSTGVLHHSTRPVLVVPTEEG